MPLLLQWVKGAWILQKPDVQNNKGGALKVPRLCRVFKMYRLVEGGLGTSL